MKKLIQLIMAFIFAFALVVPMFVSASAAMGDSFETAIEITPVPTLTGPELIKPLHKYKKDLYTYASFTDPKGHIYFAFTADGDTCYLPGVRGGSKRGTFIASIYDSDYNYFGGTDFIAGEKYYVEVYRAWDAKDTDLDFGVIVVDRGEFTTMQVVAETYLPVFGVALLYVLLVIFVYSNIIKKRYDYNVLSGGLILTIGLILGNLLFNELNDAISIVDIDWNMDLWFFLALMIPGFIMMTIGLIKETKNPLVIIINSIVMGAFFVLLGLAAMMLIAIVIAIAITVILFRMKVEATVSMVKSTAKAATGQ